MMYDDATVRRVLRVAHEGQDWRDVALKNDVKLRTAYRWINAAEDSSNWEASPLKPRGGKRHSKIHDEYVDYLVGLIDDNCYITLDEMVDVLEARFALKVTRQTVKTLVDAQVYTVKQTHRDNNYRNLVENKILRSDNVAELIAQKAAGKKIFYVEETNFNLWCARRRGRSKKGKRAVNNNTASKGSNIHVIACISEEGLAYSEKRFGSFTSEACNEYIRRLLNHIGASTSLENVVLVCDNAPCHANIEDVFKEATFSSATLLRRGPYSPMLNPIENCFSVFKAMVKPW